MTPSIVVLGHKDHGKSTFLGRLLFDTKSVPEDKVKTIREIDVEAGRIFEWAHLLDAFKEEREEEMTYDTAAMFVKGKERVYSFIDVPGHAELVHQMLSGASRAEAALLIISAKEGVDVMSVKHMVLAGLLGIDRLVVAVNKMDLMNYQEEAFTKIREEIAGQIKTAGFDPGGVIFVPIAAATGANIAERSPEMEWYSGLAVFELMESWEFSNRAAELPLRILIQDVYVTEEGPWAVAHVKSGRANRDISLEVWPENSKLDLKNMRSVDGEPTEEAAAGMNLMFPAVSGLERGVVLGNSDDRPVWTARAEARIFLFRELDQAVPLIVECGKFSAKNKTFWSLPTHQVSEVKLDLESPLLFDVEPTFLNKFVLKQAGQIVGVGAILKA